MAAPTWGRADSGGGRTDTAAGRATTAPAPFTPAPLQASAPLPLPARPVEVAERLARLAGLGIERDGAKGVRLQVLSDGLPQALTAAELPLQRTGARIVTAVGEEPEGAAGHGPPRRLVVELELATLGRIRLDGLADAGRFDVLMAPVPDHLRPGLRALWALVREHTGLEGDLDFLDRPGASP